MKKWAFLVHPRNEQDIKENWQRIPIKGLAEKLMHLFLKGPVKLTEVKFPAGWVIGVPKMPAEILKNPSQTRKEVLKGILYAYELGARVIGLGELLAPVTAGGRWLIGKVPEDLLVTNGNSLTAGVVVQDVKDLKKLFRKISLVAIVGATGSIGTAVSKLLAQDEYPLLLVARNKNKLASLAADLETRGEGKITWTADLKNIVKADLVIVLTSGSGGIIEDEHLKPGAIVYDITQPSNLSAALMKRSDLVVFKGGLVRLPEFMDDFEVNFQLPPRTIFACLAETLILTDNLNNFNSSKLTGPVNPEIAQFLWKRAEFLGFSKLMPDY